MNRSWIIRGAPGRWMLALGFFTVASVVLIIPLIVGVQWSLVDPDVGWFPPAIVPPSLSLANWRAMLAVPEIGQAFAMSFLIAPIVTALCAALALPTGYALGRRQLRARRTIELLVLAPIILPGIVLATGLGSMFIRLGLSHTVAGVVLVQTVVLLPFMIRIVAATFEGVPQDLIDAARNLGASPWPLAPGNTLAARELAWRAGATVAEIDDQLTRDGHVVLMHDRSVARTTNGSGFVADLTRAELQALDAGAWFDRKFAGERVPTLADVLNWSGGRLGFLIELKNYPRREMPLVERTIAEIEAHRAQDYVVLAGFDHVTLAEIHRLRPVWPLEMIVIARLADPVHAARAAGAPRISLDPDVCLEPA